MVALDVTQAQSTQDRRIAAAMRLGEETTRVGAYKMNLYKMREAGVLVDISIHGITMFTKRAGWLELGIPAKDVRAAQFTRGSKYLIPRRYIGKLEGIDTRIRNNLDKYGASISGFKPYRYLTYEAAARWLEDLARLEAELEQLKAQIIRDYDTFKDTAVATHTDSAREAWDALISRQGGDPDNAALQLNENTVIPNREAFVQHITEKVLEQFPSVEAIRQTLRVERHYQIGLSSADLAEDAYLEAHWDALAAERRAETAYHNEKADAQRRLAMAEENAERRVIQEREFTQRRLIKAEAEDRELAVKERRAKLDAVKEVFEQEIREQIADTILPLQEVMLQERHRLHDGLNQVLESINKNGFLHHGTATKMEGLIERFRFFEHFDESLIPEVDSLEQALAMRIPHPDKQGAVTYDVDKVQSQVRALILHTQEAAQVITRDQSATRAAALML